MESVIKLHAPAEKGQYTIFLPASKSISNRALIIRALSATPFEIVNIAKCDDTDRVVEAVESENKDIYVGAAGTAMRFLTAYFTLKEGEHVLNGTERMRQRPIKLLVDALRTLGANISYVGNEGFPPIKIVGQQMQGGDICLQGSVSSQYISAILMIAPLLEHGVKLTLLGDIISRPYITLTLELMKQLGVQSSWTDGTIEVRRQAYQGKTFFVESDWSAASYWYEIVALTKQEIFLQGLRQNSLQGDSKVSTLFQSLGVKTSFTTKGVLLSYIGGLPQRMNYNFVEQPDLAQTLVTTCCALGIPFYFTGLRSLKIKETNRVMALIDELAKLGFILTEPADGALEWKGETCKRENPATISTYEDHRMAMAFAPLACKFDGLQIKNPEVVSKSYPTYWEDLKMIGFKIVNCNTNTL